MLNDNKEKLIGEKGIDTLLEEKIEERISPIKNNYINERFGFAYFLISSIFMDTK